MIRFRSGAQVRECRPHKRVVTCLVAPSGLPAVPGLATPSSFVAGAGPLTSGGFTAEEKAAMKATAKERKAQETREEGERAVR